MTIAYKITIGSNVFQSPDKSALKELVVDSSLQTPVNLAMLTFAQTDNVSAKAGDKISIELGLHGKTKKVFSGLVNSVGNSLTEINLQATSSAELLMRTCYDAVFENKSCGAIVKDIFGTLKLDAGTVEDGLTFPRYVVSGNKSLWKNLSQLASYCGTDLFSDAEDKIQFKSYKKSSPALFNYGEDILHFSKNIYSPTLDGVVVFGDSPAGQGQSDEANFWFKKTEVKASAGKSTGNVSRQTVYAARNKDLCEKIAKNIFDTHQSKASGRAIVLNGEKLALGGSVSFKKLPTSSLNGDYKISALSHRVNETEGFTTEIMWEEKE